MPGNYQRHVDDFGFCDCRSRSGTESMELEVEERGRVAVQRMPACSDCYGLL